MKKVFCKGCTNKHFDGYECSKCGCHHGRMYPVIYQGSDVKARFCNYCGHQFVVPDDIDISNDS